MYDFVRKEIRNESVMEVLLILLTNVELDAQILCFIIGFLQSSTCFEQRRAHHQEVKLYSICYRHTL
jgi:hypothetical protein